MVQIPQKARQWYLPEVTSAGINSLAIRTFDVPQPTANQVLVKIHAVSLNFKDIALARNEFPRGIETDFVPCCDGAGEVVAVGADVTKWAVGDRVSPHLALNYIGAGPTAEIFERALGVSVDGTLTEYQIFPDYCLVKIPDYLSYEEASTLPCAAVTAWATLQGPVPVKAGDYVLVLGTGGVSIFALQFAAASGATVIVTSSSNDKLAKAKELGAKHVINYKETPEWDKEVLKITNGEGVHHVIDVGGANTISKSVHSLRMDGWVYVVGFLGGNESQDGVPLAMNILYKHANVRGVLLGPRTMFEDMNRALDASKIKPVVDSVFGFDEAVDAYKRVESQRHIGKVVIRVTKD